MLISGKVSNMAIQTISEMVETLRNSPIVLGLVEYGGAHYSDGNIRGDYDLVVVLTEGCPEVESLHFYIGETPVDLNVRAIEDIERMGRAEGIDSVLLGGRTIYDPSGKVASALKRVRVKHEDTPVLAIAPAKISAMRHGARHTFDKIEDRSDLNMMLNRYLLHQCVYWLVPQYFEVRGIQYRGEKHAFQYLRQNEQGVSKDLEEFYATADYGRQKQLARSIAEAALAPVGGLWKDDELLVFGDHQNGQELFEQLLGAGDD